MVFAEVNLVLLGVDDHERVACNIRYFICVGYVLIIVESVITGIICRAVAKLRAVLACVNSYSRHKLLLLLGLPFFNLGVFFLLTAGDRGFFIVGEDVLGRGHGTI